MGLNLIPARQGTVAKVQKGASIEVINTHGNQVLDTWAFNANDLQEAMSMEHTRSVNSQIYAKVGEGFASSRRRPMMRLTKDTSPGRHDTLLCCCNQGVYTELGCTEYHRNCEDNLREALASVGVEPPFIPGPLNLFMNVTVADDGKIVRQAPASKAGDLVELYAEMDVIVVFSSCPQDITPINGLACTPSDTHYRIIG